jgi:hypothetical protein
MNTRKSTNKKTTRAFSKGNKFFWFLFNRLLEIILTILAIRAALRGQHWLTWGTVVILFAGLLILWLAQLTHQGWIGVIGLGVTVLVWIGSFVGVMLGHHTALWGDSLLDWSWLIMVLSVIRFIRALEALGKIGH